MTAILGFADLLLQPDGTAEETHEYLQIIRENGRVLLQLINDILDLSKIEAERMAIEKGPRCPWELVDEVISLLRVRAEEKGIELRAECDSHVPPVIFTDPIRLRQILVNLVGNAIKFTEQGSVLIRLWHSPPTAPLARLSFAVADTGIGISPAVLAHIFQPFTQADTSHSRRFGGSGLGLAISRRLAQKLGGTIEVASEPGRGSTFTLSIDPGSIDALVPPLRTLSNHPQAIPQTERRFSGRVLLAEDVQASVHLVCTMLKRAGVQVDVAGNGRMACDKCTASLLAGTPYDLVLMDVQMPEMDGLEATRALRSAGWKAPIIALTAHAMNGDREKCLAAGCDSYLSKPLDRQALVQLLARHLKPAD